MNVFSSVDELSAAAATRFAVIAAESVAARGRFVVALSGGSTPKRLYAHLAAEPYLTSVPWDKTYVLYGDERFVPADDEQSNEKSAVDGLLSKVTVAGAYGMVRSATPEEDADRYEALVRSLLGPELAIDLTLLGIGPDAHTASLFPGQPYVFEKDRLVVAAKANVGVQDRITMTPPLLNRSRHIVFLVAGADKVGALETILNGPEDWNVAPTQAVSRHAAAVEWMVERASLTPTA